MSDCCLWTGSILLPICNQFFYCKCINQVGLHLEHGYARSITQFAADLGPVVWKIASKKIERVLPVGLKFGPGWIGENEALKHLQSLFTEEKSSESSIPYDNTSKLLHHSTSDSNTVVANGFLWQGREDFEITDLDSKSELISLKSSIGGREPVPRFGIQQKHTICSDINGLNGGFGSDTSVPSQMLGIDSSGNTTICPMSRKNHESNEAGFPETARTHSGNLLALGSGTTSEVVLGGKASWQRSAMHHKNGSFSFPPDLNVSFRQTGSHSSNVQIVAAQQPDLALQL
jgi:hypothetical protein